MVSRVNFFPGTTRNTSALLLVSSNWQRISVALVDVSSKRTSNASATSFPNRFSEAVNSVSEITPSSSESRPANSSASFRAKVSCASSLSGKSRTVALLRPGSCANTGLTEQTSNKQTSGNIQPRTFSIEPRMSCAGRGLDVGCWLLKVECFLKAIFWGFTAVNALCLAQIGDAGKAQRRLAACGQPPLWIAAVYGCEWLRPLCGVPA